MRGAMAERVNAESVGLNSPKLIWGELASQQRDP